MVKYVANVIIYFADIRSKYFSILSSVLVWNENDFKQWREISKSGEGVSDIREKRYLAHVFVLFISFIIFFFLDRKLYIFKYFFPSLGSRERENFPKRATCASRRSLVQRNKKYFRYIWWRREFCGVASERTIAKLIKFCKNESSIRVSRCHWNVCLDLRPSH